MRLTLTLALVASIAFTSAAQGQPTTSTSAAARMSTPGAETASLAAQVGEWDVVATLWPGPGAAPVITQGLVARREMIGSILQEVMQPIAPGAADFRRLDYLDYDRVEGRWKYVSMDTRFPVSIMPAWGDGRSKPADISLRFAAQAFVGFGPEVEGRFMVSEMRISSPTPHRLVKEQQVLMADGSGRSWTLARYEYTRRQ